MALQEEFEKRGLWLFRYRGLLPLVILVAGTLIYLHGKLQPGFSCLDEQPYEFYYEIFCLIVGLFGLGIRIYTVAYTPPLTSGRNVKGQLAETLNNTGIYSIVRHPLYLGNFFMWLSPALLTGHIWFILFFCLVYWIYYERIMFAEEQFLRKKFGKPYLEWAEAVPAFIPKRKGFKRPLVPFNWKKVLRNEKNGLAALFLILCLFDIAGELVRNETNYNFILWGGLILSTVLYLVLKYLKYKTKALKQSKRT